MTTDQGAQAHAARTPGVVPSGVRGAVAGVRIEDPLALFVPERLLVGTVPLPLYLLELVPGSVKSDYERTASGIVANEADRIRRRTVRYPGGLQVRVEVHGDQVRGLPTTFDYDYFLALCRIADEGGVDAQGYFRDPGYRAVLRAAGRNEGTIGGDQIEAVKRAFARFGGLILYTRLDVDYSGRSALVRAGTRHPLVPDGAPPVREREGKHWVLEYDVEAEYRSQKAYNSIDRLRINPIWLDQAAAGIAAWMDVGLHNSLRSAYAKRLLQIFTVRAARGWRVLDPWVLDLAELYTLLDVPPAMQPKTQTRTGVEAAVRSLVEHGVLGEGAITRLGRGTYEVRLVAGERLLAAGYQRGTGGTDSLTDRMLLWHLRALGLAAGQARDLVRARPDQVRTVLRRVYYLQAHMGGVSHGRPVEDWGAWTRAAIEGEYAFSDPDWQRWLDRQLDAGQRGEWEALNPPPSPIALAVGPAKGSPAAGGRRTLVTAAPPGEDHAAGAADAGSEQTREWRFADDVWGRTLEQFVAADPAHGRAYDAWLARTTLGSVTDDQVTVLAEDAFAADWIAQKYRDPLTSLLAAVTGRPLGLVIRAESARTTRLREEPHPPDEAQAQSELFGPDSSRT
ncbi:MAG TPA: DnaA N-terminal domain-containing protein [Gemmatirosa sp.]